MGKKRVKVYGFVFKNARRVDGLIKCKLTGHVYRAKAQVVPSEREAASTKPHHMIASSNSRISLKNMPRLTSNDMVHNHYLEEAKKKTQECSRNSEPSLMHSVRSRSTTNGSKPMPKRNTQTSRNWPASKNSFVTTKTVPIVEPFRNSRNFSDSKHFVCSTCQKCVFSANHDSCVTKFLKEVNSCATVPSNKTPKRNKPVEQISVPNEQERQIPTGHRFSIKKTSVVQKKTMTPRSCLRWKMTGKIFKTVGLRWVPTGRISTSSTTKVDNEPPNGSNADITSQYECEQTLDVSAVKMEILLEPTANKLLVDKGNSFKLTLEIFRDIMKIFPRVQRQDFDALLTDEEIVSFLRELGHTREINLLNVVVVDHMHQPWRTFTALINKSLSGKTTSLDKLLLVSPEEPTKKSKRVKRPENKSSKAPAGVALTEEAQYEEVRKKSLRDFHKTHLSGFGTVTKTAPSATKIKPSITNKGTGVKPGVPDVTEEVSTESEPESWGKDEDDNNNEQDSRSEGSDQDKDSEKEDEYERTSYYYSPTKDKDKINVDDNVEGDKDKEMDYTTSQLYDDVDIRLNEPVDTDEGFVQNEGIDVEMTNTEVSVTSSSHSSDLASKFLNFSNIPYTDVEIVSSMDVHVYHEQAQKKQQSLYNGKVLLEKHDPPVVHDFEETRQLAQESREKMKQLNKEIKPANYTKINHLLGVFVSQMAKSREELYFSNASKTANVSKPISIPNEEFSDDTTPSVARKFLNETHALSKQVTSNSIPTPQESKVMKNDKVIAPGMFRINPFKTFREEKHVPNNVRASVRTKPVAVSQPPVFTKKDVNSDSNSLSSTGIDNAKTRRPQPRSNIKNDRVPYVSTSSYNKNKGVEVEEHHRNLLLFKNKKHMSSACNNIKLDSQNVISKVVCAMCKQCLISVNHDVCLRNYVNGKTSRGKGSSLLQWFEFGEEGKRFGQLGKISPWGWEGLTLEIQVGLGFSDYAGASLDRKSTTGVYQFLGSRLISWQCKKQTVMLDYGYNFMQKKIHVDNESVIYVIKNPVYPSKTKHIEIRHHFIRDSYEKRLIEMVKIHTNNNVTDLLTKAFDGNQVMLPAMAGHRERRNYCINALIALHA
uniref:Uncharacterized protein n=1 Tax=Tanacetum cinerariifolium TaxID=118510 RepID=A0A6L2P1L3_TANCI|nr:hypothetical protein [Tanacetum cinerariifolium]